MKACTRVGTHADEMIRSFYVTISSPKRKRRRKGTPHTKSFTEYCIQKYQK